MSNYLAIATVTATLQKLLQNTVQADVEGARVTTVRPDNAGTGIPETGVNIFLYRIVPVHWNNADIPGRRTLGDSLKRPHTAVDLNYIFTFYGNEAELEPQRLLGSLVRTLYSQPTLKKETIESTISDNSFKYLRESNLAEQVESIQSIKFLPLPLSTEDLSKIWSVFFQTPYSLSIGYQGCSVLIESEVIPRRALPVRQFAPRMNAFKPTISEVLSRDGLTRIWRSAVNKPVLATSNINILGTGLLSGNTTVRIGNEEIQPTQASNKEINVDLRSVSQQNLLRAGVQSIQIIQRDSENNKRLRESNLLPFILFPTIEYLRVTNVETIDEEVSSAELSLSTNPIVGKTQRVVIILNQTSPTDPAEYFFDLPTRLEDTNQITANIANIKAGEYLVRISIDGVENLLSVDRDPNSLTFDQFIGPKITIS